VTSAMRQGCPRSPRAGGRIGAGAAVLPVLLPVALAGVAGREAPASRTVGQNWRGDVITQESGRACQWVEILMDHRCPSPDCLVLWRVSAFVARDAGLALGEPATYPLAP
jgi:hypothetical protein